MPNAIDADLKILWNIWKSFSSHYLHCVKQFGINQLEHWFCVLTYPLWQNFYKRGTTVYFESLLSKWSGWESIMLVPLFPWSHVYNFTRTFAAKWTLNHINAASKQSTSWMMIWSLKKVCVQYILDKLADKGQNTWKSSIYSCMFNFLERNENDEKEKCDRKQGCIQILFLACPCLPTDHLSPAVGSWNL